MQRMNDEETAKRITFSKKIRSSTVEVRRFDPVVVSVLLECRMVGEIACTLLVIVKRFFFVAVVAGDFDVEAERLFGMLFVLVDELVIVRLGEGGRMTSSFTVVEVRTVMDGADESIARDVRGEVLLMVRNEEDVDVVVREDETGLLMIRRGVGVVMIGLGLIGTVGGFTGAVVDIGGVELPDEERISEMEFDRS